MDDTSQTLKPWVTFAGCVLVVVVLYWAQAVLVPIALAILLTFVLTPPVSWLERRIGRVPAVLAVVTLVFTVLGSRRLGSGATVGPSGRRPAALPVNILAKIADMRGAGKGGSVEKLQETIEDIKTDLGQSETPAGDGRAPVVVTSEPVAGFSGFSWLGPSGRPAGHGRTRAGHGHLHAARTPGSARSADRAVRARPADAHDEGVRRGGHARQPPVADAVARQSGLRHRRRRSASTSSACRTRGSGQRSARRCDSSRTSGPCSAPARRFWSASRRSRAGPVRSGSIGLVRGARAVHEPRARDGAVCRGGRRLSGGAAGVRRVLDLAVGTARPAAWRHR